MVKDTGLLLLLPLPLLPLVNPKGPTSKLFLTIWNHVETEVHMLVRMFSIMITI